MARSAARTTAFSLAALLAVSGAALAQTSGSQPKAGSGAPAAPGRAAPAAHPELDLPIVAPPVPQPALPVEPPPVEPPPETPGTDPVDEPPPTFFGEEIPSETDTIFYVIDRSGSMTLDQQSFVGPDGQVQTGNKMDRAKAELIRSIMGLSMNFKFNIVSYDCGTSAWSDQLMEADDANKQSASAWVNALSAGGRTGTGPATSLALSDKENKSVVLLTDGAPNCGADGLEGHRVMISSNNTQGATVNVFGIAASGSYRDFCQNVAADSGGSYYDVP